MAPSQEASAPDPIDWDAFESLGQGADSAEGSGPVVAWTYASLPPPGRTRRSIFVSDQLLDASADRQLLGDQLVSLAERLGSSLRIVRQRRDVRDAVTVLGVSRAAELISWDAWYHGASAERQMDAIVDTLSGDTPNELVIVFMPKLPARYRRWVHRSSTVAVSALFEVDTLEPIDVWSFTRQVDRDLRAHLGVGLATWPTQIETVRSVRRSTD